MSSVRKKDQSEHRFTVLDKILDLYEHTSIVVANPKFDKCHALADRLDYEASMIYHLCRVANEDLDNRVQEEAAERLRLQKEALKHCLWLKTDIRLVQKKLHLRASKAIYWTELVNNAISYIKAWNNAEKKQYQEIYGL